MWGAGLYDYCRHRGGRNLRGHYLQPAEMALVKSREGGDDHVDAMHVEAALAELT